MLCWPAQEADTEGVTAPDKPLTLSPLLPRVCFCPPPPPNRLLHQIEAFVPEYWGGEIYHDADKAFYKV